MEIKEYKIVDKQEWDLFVKASRNGTFLHERDFMDYHSDRFQDSSLMFYDEGSLVAVLPANLKGDTLFSHQGLTYGGFILHFRLSIAQMREIVDCLIMYAQQKTIKHFVYKPVPRIYHRYPSDEDLYALFHRGAQLTKRSISSAISHKLNIGFDRSRKRAVKRGIKQNYKLIEETDAKTFWNILNDNLERKFGVAPVHSYDEIMLLKEKFQENIRIFGAYDSEGKMDAGALFFVTDQVAHMQYCSTTEDGRKYGALDILIDSLIQTVFLDHAYIDFGTSTEDEGRFLNEGLIFQKEGFGGRGVVYDTYEMNF